MNRIFCFTVTAIFLTSGCASTENGKTIENKAVVSQSTIASNQQSPNVNRDSTIDADNKANKIVLGDSSISQKNVQKLKTKNFGSKESAPIAEKIETAKVPAPDNSEIFNQMNEKGQPIETRVFNRNPILQKIERIDLDNQNIKVHLKNGKILTLPENAAKSFTTASAAEILKSVGIDVK